MSKRVLALMLSLSAFAVVAANPKFTWTGGAGPLAEGEWAGYYSWKDASNWDAAGVPTAGGKSGDTAIILDFTALAANAKVVCDSGVKHCLGEMTFGANLGTIELVSATSGSNVDYLGSKTWTVPAGTKVLFGLNKAAATSDYYPTITLTGGGEFRITSPAAFSAYRNRFNVAANTTLGLDSTVADFRTLYVDLQTETSTLDLGRDVEIGLIIGTSTGSGRVVLNGHALRIGVGYCTNWNIVDATVANRFQTVGNGSVTYAGGASFTNVAAQTFSGGLTLVNADVSAEAFPNASSIDIAGSGVLMLGADQSVAALTGASATGGIVLGDDSTLTVADSGAEAKTYAARLSGAGAFVKDGSNELILSGANALTGPLTVKGGMLTAKGELAAGGAETALAHGYRFEDSLADDSGTGSAKFSYYYGSGDVDAVAEGCTASEFCAGRNGTRGVRLHHMSRASVQETKGFNPGKGPFTVSVWMIPSEDMLKSSETESVNWGDNAIFYLGSGANTALNSFKVYTHKGTNINVSAGDYYIGDVVDKFPDYGFTCKVGRDVLYDGGWHMLTVTYSGVDAGQTLTLYLDGKALGSKAVTVGEINLTSRCHLGWGGYGSLSGRFDDFKVLTRCQTAAEVKAEYLGEVQAGDDFAALPKPVAHWAFDDAANPGKDSSGNGYDLVDYTGYTASVTDIGGAYGKALAKGSPMSLAAIPEKIPTGNRAWTVSARYMIDGVVQKGTMNNSSVFFWGDNRIDLTDFDNDSYKFLQVTVANASAYAADNYRVIRPGLKFDNAKYCTFYNDNGVFADYGSMMDKAGPANWVNFVAVWNPTDKKFYGYADGVSIGTVTRSQMDISAAGRLLVGLRPGYGTGDNNVEVPFEGYIDDIRVFDTAFTAEQVMTLTRGLKDGTVGAPLSAASDLTVASGATLNVEGTGHAAKSLAGTGAVNLSANSSLAVGGGSVGTLTGLGQLTVSAPLKAVSAAAYYGNVVLSGSGTVDFPGYAAAVTLPDPYAVALDSVAALPLVRTSGTVTFPAEGTITFPSLPEEVTDTLVAEAGRLVLPADFTGWTIEPDNANGLKSKLYVRDGKVYLKRKPTSGLILLFR